VSQLKLHGLKAEDALIEVMPRDPGTNVIEEDDMVAMIEEHGHETALIMFSGVHYLTGQVFDMKRLAETGKRAGCMVAFDLAHVIGNVPLKVHEWGVDFAVWCTYKYLNSGPGAIGGLFVHERHHESISRLERPLLAGWWGVRLEERFLMDTEFKPGNGAQAFQQSCTPIFNSCGVEASMELFRQVNMETLHRRSWSLCKFFRDIIGSMKDLPFRIVTPSEFERSAAQLSLAFAERSGMLETFERLHSLGVITDRREPNILRITFCGLYNRFEDVFLTALALKTVCTQ
jgi:kynureninase